MVAISAAAGCQLTVELVGARATWREGRRLTDTDGAEVAYSLGEGAISAPMNESDNSTSGAEPSSAEAGADDQAAAPRKRRKKALVA